MSILFSFFFHLPRLIFLPSFRSLWEQVFSIFELKIMFEEKELQMIQVFPFQEKEREGGGGRSQFGGPWKVPSLGDP